MWYIVYDIYQVHVFDIAVVTENTRQLTIEYTVWQDITIELIFYNKLLETDSFGLFHIV